MSPNSNLARWRLTLMAATGLALAACSETPEPSSPPVRPAFVSEVRAGDADQLSYVGEVRAAQRAELAFAVSGRVAAVMVEPGDSVRAGQVLAQLDEQPLRAQLAATSGDTARAQAALAETRQRLQRLAQAVGATSAAETSAVQAEVATAEAALRAAQAQQDLAAWSLAQASLRAPVSGVVAKRLLEPGQATGPGAPAIALDGAGRELSILVPATLALRPGQAVTLRQEGRAFESRVLRIAGRLEAGGVRRVFLAVPDSAVVGSIWAASLGVPDSAGAVQVPLRAVLPTSESGKGQVLRVARDGRTVEAAAVTLGSLHGEWVDVTAGLARGDRVVVAGAASIPPGSTIKPVVYTTGSR